MVVKIFDVYGLECYYTCNNIFAAFDYCYSLLNKGDGDEKLIICVFMHDENLSHKCMDIYLDYVNKNIMFYLA